jgi:hypothetical protein
MNPRVLSRFTGLQVVRWMGAEWEGSASQPDLLGETREGRLLHVELLSNNDGGIAE